MIEHRHLAALGSLVAATKNWVGDLPGDLASLKEIPFILGCQAGRIRRLETALTALLGRYVSAIGNEGIECIEARTALVDGGPTWTLITSELLSNPPKWFHGPLWISRNGAVVAGNYLWRQGTNPDRLKLAGGGDWDALGSYVMPLWKPAPPRVES